MKEKISAVYDRDYDMLERKPTMPQEADFALILTDDCMEPFFKKGERVYVKARAELEEFEAGLFLYEGRVVCRQWCQDHTGAVHLLCANPARERENISLRPGEKLTFLGRLLTKKKLPQPFYK